jgi:hypothetical protein
MKLPHVETIENPKIFHTQQTSTDAENRLRIEIIVGGKLRTLNPKHVLLTLQGIVV